MPSKKFTVLILAALFTAILPFVANANDFETEVIIMIQDEEILAFSGYKNHWVPIKINLAEKVSHKRYDGNTGVVATNKRLFGFSVLVDQWVVLDLKMNEQIEEIVAEGNVATVRTNYRVLGFGAHSGQWIEAP